MGVRGLTSFIAKNADRYLHAFELHDCDLVIDGDNLACNLYKDTSQCNSAFGGDYDEYYRTVVNFFQMLEQCNVRAFVLLDGGYESKKIRTVERRLRIKIGIVKYLNPADCRPIFPVMMREVFIDAVRDCGVPLMRCLYEADDEIAILARKLNCPVLSYDSDFYIYNVKYIPVVTLTFKIYEKEIDVEPEEKSLSQSESKRIKKKFNKKHLKDKSLQRSTSSVPVKEKKKIKYLDCCIYTIESLLKLGSLDIEMLPLFAALIGNDYIENTVFQIFYNQISQKNTNKKVSRQHRRIIVILRWLQHETKDSATEKILARIKKEERTKLLQSIEDATSGYCRENSKAFEYFGLEQKNPPPEICEVEENEEETTSNPETEFCNADSGDEDSTCDSDSSMFDTDVSDASSEADSDMGDSEMASIKEFATSNGVPEWLEKKINSGDLPRFFVDLFHLNLYINNPMIENFSNEDANSISIDIIRYIYYLITKVPDDSEIKLRYLSRFGKTTNVKYVKLLPLSDLYTNFQPYVTDMTGFRKIFDRLSPYLQTTNFFNYPKVDEIFTAIEELPSNLRLYFLAIVYWSIKSSHGNEIHLYSMILCLIVLNVIDAKVEPIRDQKEFQKKFGKMMHKTKSEKTKLEQLNADPLAADKATKSLKNEKAQKIKGLLDVLTPAEKIKYLSKKDCLLVQDNLLGFFHLSDKFHKRHNDFSSQVIHGFSEFQSVVFHLYSLNLLFNCPFETIRMSQFYNGLFLYNMYANLKDRRDINYFIQNHIFQDSPVLLDYYKYLVNWCKRFFPVFKYVSKWKSTREVKKKRNVTRDNRENLISDMIDSTSDSEVVKEAMSQLKI